MDSPPFHSLLALRFTACLAASVAGFWIGWKLAKRPKKMPWLILALGFVIAFINYGSDVLPPNLALRWEEIAYYGIGGQMAMALCIPIVGMQAAEAISNRVLRVLVLALLAFAFFERVWLVTLDSLTTLPQLHALKTKYTSTGACLQSTGYTCGPAAGVTALGVLGYKVEEGPLALASETGKFFGTDEFRLAWAMNQAAKGGLNCHVIQFQKVDELRGLPPVLIIMHLSGNIAHYIVVLKLDGQWVDYSDPLMGNARMRRENLETNWTGRGIICDPR